jgi:hypothetical protein
MTRPAQPNLPNLYGVLDFCTRTATTVAVAYTIPVRLRYIAVAYKFFCTPLMIIPPMTYFRVVN